MVRPNRDTRQGDSSDRDEESNSPLLSPSSTSHGRDDNDYEFDPHDAAFQNLSLNEQKSLLINRELNAMGMGRYQWYIWTLCGLGYFLDLLWAQAFGLIATPLQQELGFTTRELGEIFTAFSAGLAIGAFVWGVLVDVIGRKWAFNGTVALSCIFGTCLALPESYWLILLLTALTGFGIGGNIPIDTTITLEFLPQNKRFLLALLSAFQPLGVVICSGIAYAYIPFNSCAAKLPSCNISATPCCSKADNYGWRYLIFTLGGISATIFILRFILFTFQESPKFLLSKGRDEDALEVLRQVAKVNGTKCHLDISTFKQLETNSRHGTREADPTLSKPLSEKAKAEVSRLMTLFENATLTRLTILVWIIYAFDYWGFSIAGSFLPTILARKNAAIHVSISQTYLDYIIIHLPGILGVLLSTYLSSTTPRRPLLFFTSLSMSLSLLAYTAVTTQALNVTANAFEYFFQSAFNAVLYAWTPEAFPAEVRGTASGIASFWGRSVGIFAPLVAARVLEGSLDAPLYLAAGGTGVCCLAVLLLPGSSLKKGSGGH